ncbi:MAG: hypothetical protein LBC74_02690, partial [Planctomycetaceae bacterium]|nr:hypothetical protein [Planctomycetaceae bacterium]
MVKNMIVLSGYCAALCCRLLSKKNKFIFSCNAKTSMSVDPDKLNSLRKLVDLFASNITQYKGVDYDESNVRVDFIDKFFELLDWDVRNEQGFTETHR